MAAPSSTFALPESDTAPLASAPLSRFLRVPDLELEKVHDALWDLKQALALQCVFLAGCCHRARAAAIRGSATDGKASGDTSSTVTVGIIGGGTIGGVVAHALVDAGIPPSAVLLSTRSPSRQEDLSARGVAVVFDNALVASKAHMLVLAVLPAQLQDVARSLRPAPNMLLLSLVGATPLNKVRQLFEAPYAIGSAADATLPLLMQEQDAARAAAGGGVDKTPLDAGRLEDETVLELAACGFASDPMRLARLVEALIEALGDLALPPALARSIAIEAVYGAQPGGVLALISAELTRASAQPASAGVPEVGEESDAVLRARTAFVSRIRGHVEPTMADDEEELEAPAKMTGFGRATK